MVCLEAAKGLYKERPWTQSATWLLATKAYDVVSRFPSETQRDRIKACFRWIESHRSGGGGGGGGQGAERCLGGFKGKGAAAIKETSFDAAVKSWGRKEGISRRST